MTDTRSTQRALDAQREKLQAEYKKLEARMAQVRDRLHAIDLLANDREFLASLLAEQSEPGTNGQGYSQLGLRDAIRAVLTGAATPLKPIQVTKELEKGGFQFSGGMSLSTRVSSEMHRMMRRGELHRTKQKRLYRLATPGTTYQEEPEND